MKYTIKSTNKINKDMYTKKSIKIMKSYKLNM